MKTKIEQAITLKIFIRLFENRLEQTETAFSIIWAKIPRFANQLISQKLLIKIKLLKNKISRNKSS